MMLHSCMRFSVTSWIINNRNVSCMMAHDFSYSRFFTLISIFVEINNYRISTWSTPTFTNNTCRVYRLYWMLWHCFLLIFRCCWGRSSFERHYVQIFLFVTFHWFCMKNFSLRVSNLLIKPSLMWIIFCFCYKFFVFHGQLQCRSARYKYQNKKLPSLPWD